LGPKNRLNLIKIKGSSNQSPSSNNAQALADILVKRFEANKNADIVISNDILVAKKWYVYFDLTLTWSERKWSEHKTMIAVFVILCLCYIFALLTNTKCYMVLTSSYGCCKSKFSQLFYKIKWVRIQLSSLYFFTMSLSSL